MSGTSRQPTARPLALPGLERGLLRRPEDHIPQMQTALLDWFAAHGRPLPWRVDYNPYEVWISEVMLQQTQMDRGVDYFTRWIRRFPDIAALAAASENEVLRLWEGLGYYSRARRLQTAARRITEKHGGVFPSTLPDIRALPGVGAYTAAAVASIAFNTPVPCVDANVERVLARVFNVDSPVGQSPAAERIRHLARRLLPEGKAREHNQAVMELGALVCGKKARCGYCPLEPFCLARHLDVVRLRPAPGKKNIVTPLVAAVGVLRHGGRILIQKRPPAGIWANLWAFPGGAAEEGEDPREALPRAFQRETGYAVRPACSYGVIRHGYTTYRIVMHCFGLRLESAVGERTAGEGNCPPVPPSSAPVRAIHASGQETAERQQDQDSRKIVSIRAFAQEAMPAPSSEPARDQCWVTPEELAALPLPAPHRKLAERIAASDRGAPRGF